MTISRTGGRVLLAAYQCGPGLGSVSQIGWEWFRRLAARVPVTLVTHSRNREAILAAAPLPDESETIFIDTEWFAGPLYRTARRLFPRSDHAVFLLSSLDYFVYDRSALARLRRRAADFRLVHIVTPISTAAASRLHRLGRPVILGPLNSGLASPAAFPDIMRQDSAWVYPLRSLGRAAEYAAGSMRHARMILVATAATRASVPRKHRSRCRTMLENGVDLERFPSTPWPDPPGGTAPLRVLFVGRLVPFKAVGLLLDAVARVRHEIPIAVRIVGEGPMADSWRAQAATLELEDIVWFRGARPLDEVGAEMAWAHVFCLPSVRESGGAVVLEALASARPVIAIAYGGPAETVDDGVGCAIRPDGPDAVVEDLAGAFRDVVRHPRAWRARGEEGRRRAETAYDWNAKTSAAIALYDEVSPP